MVETKSFSETVEDSSTVLLCPSAILGSLDRKGVGSIYTHQKDFIPQIIESIRNGNGIYTTRFVVDNVLENPKHIKYVKTPEASELEKINQGFLCDLVREMRDKELILDFDASNERIARSGKYDDFYKLAYDSLYDIWEKRKGKRENMIRVIKDENRVIRNNKKALSLTSYLSAHCLMHMKADFIATSLILGSLDNLSVVSNDFSEIFRTYREKIHGTPIVESGSFKFFTRRSAEEFDRIMI